MADSSPFEEIHWDALLQDLPQSPMICLDDLGFPLSPHCFNEDPRNEVEDHQILGTCNGGDDINSVVNLHVSAEGKEENDHSSEPPPIDSSVLELSALSEILLSDDCLENSTFGALGVEPHEFLDIDSFFARICSPQQQQDRDDDGALNIQPYFGGDAAGNGGELPEGGGEKLGTCGRKRKRNRDSAFKSRERKKVYVRSLETKCRLLEKGRGNLEQALRYSALENATLRNELNRLKKKNSREEAEKMEVVSWSSHGRGSKTEEPAVLVMDSPQKEFVFCAVMMIMAMHLVILPVLLFLMPWKLPRAARKKEMTCQEWHCPSKKYRMPVFLIMCTNVGEGERMRKWKWCRKRMKICGNRC